jgi:hypothetical protein
MLPLAPLISGGLGLLGGMFSNNANAKIAENNTNFSAAQADKANQFSIEQNAKQMEFQKDMANTSYQRGTADMMKAGLNPMLAYSQGGAQVPSGATSVGQQATPSGYTNQNVMTGAVQGYNNTARQANETAMTPFKIKQLIAETANTTALEIFNQQATKTSASQADLNDTNRITSDSQSKLNAQTIVNLDKQLEQIQQNIRLMRSQEGTNNATTAKLGQDYKIDKYQESYGSSKFGEYNKYIGEGLNSVGKLFNQYKFGR